MNADEWKQHLRILKVDSNKRFRDKQKGSAPTTLEERIAKIVARNDEAGTSNANLYRDYLRIDKKFRVTKVG